MILVQAQALFVDVGIHPILKNAAFTLKEKERVCLVGRNGAGKSTLLKLIAKQLGPDSGEITYRQDIGISQLEQTLPEDLHRTVRETIEEGLSTVKALLQRFHALSNEASHSPEHLRMMEKLQEEIEARGGWELEQKVAAIIDQLQLPAEKTLGELSGGWRRRVLLGKALVSQPDLLLLDEPTNHLDIHTIDWLEEKIKNYAGTVLFVTHDRFFLDRLATRILEIDRGQLVSFPGNYERYLDLKEKMLEDEQTHNALFDKHLAQEEAWIRQGIKARRTRNEGRVRALEALRVERSERVDRFGKAKVLVQGAEKSGKQVIEAKDISFKIDDRLLIDQTSITIMRGDRIGLIGNNGLGKSTLLRILLGELAPQTGSVKLGTGLEVAYFDQMHRELNLEKTIAENVAEGRDYVELNGSQTHIIGYLKSFLFSARRAMTPVGALSGGERNRVLLAKLFSRPSNVLVLDEPTNDLDIEMLEVLEEQLVQYKGTLIIVSHDRNFLDHVITSTLVFEGEGKIGRYTGGYRDWLARGKRLGEIESPFEKTTKDPSVSIEKNPVGDDKMQARVSDTFVASSFSSVLNSAPKRKLSYREQRQLELLPQEIASHEETIARLTEEMQVSGFYDQPYHKIQSHLDSIAASQKALDDAMELWINLEEATSEKKL